MITDMIGREIQIDDFVVFYSNIYRVKSFGVERPAGSGRGQVRMMIWNGGDSARPVTKYSKDIAVLDKLHVMKWLMSQGAA
jgi:hypothetical protein